MKKILMVCLGNICRSPLAHGILQNKVDTSKIFVDSAGTAAYHVNEKPDKRSIQVAKKYGINITNQCARKFTVLDFDNFDKIYAMDQQNYSDILSLARNTADKKKVKLILNEIQPNLDSEIPDPYYGGNQGFENVYQMLDKVCTLIANKL